MCSNSNDNNNSNKSFNNRVKGDSCYNNHDNKWWQCGDDSGSTNSSGDCYDNGGGRSVYGVMSRTTTITTI